MLLPFVLGSSPHLPVSVCGTGISIQSLQAFLVSVILDTSLLLFSLHLSIRVFPLPRLSSSPASLASFKYGYSAGISTCYPSDTPFGLSLGPDLPWADEPSPGILRFSAGRILTCLFAYLYLHSHFLTLQHSFRYAFSVLRTLLYQCALTHSAASVNDLSPVTFSAQNPWTSELLRTL